MEENPNNTDKDQSEASLASLARTIRRWRRPFFTLSIGLPLITAVIMLFTANSFTATGTILVETPDGPMGPDMLGQIRAFTGLATQVTPTEMYLAILQSDRVQMAVAENLDLPTHYDVDGDVREEVIEKTLFQMGKQIRFETPDLVSIIIAATDSDPAKAAEIVNGFLDELEVASQTLALSRARRTRQLVSQSLRDTEAELDSTRSRMQEFQEINGVFSIEKQTTGTLELIGILQTELLASQAKRDQLGGFTSESSSSLRNLDLKIQGLQTQIRQLVVGDIKVKVSGEEVPRVATGSESFFLPLADIPALAKEYAGIYTDVVVQETKYQVLATQLEQTKIEESQSIPSFEILDRGRKPFRKSGPQRKLFVMAALLAGVMGGVLMCVLLDDLSTRVDETTRKELAGLVPDFILRRFS